MERAPPCGGVTLSLYLMHWTQQLPVKLTATEKERHQPLWQSLVWFVVLSIDVWINSDDLVR